MSLICGGLGKARGGIRLDVSKKFPLSRNSRARGFRVRFSHRQARDRSDLAMATPRRAYLDIVVGPLAEELDFRGSDSHGEQLLRRAAAWRQRGRPRCTEAAIYCAEEGRGLLGGPKADQRRQQLVGRT